MSTNVPAEMCCVAIKERIVQHPLQVGSQTQRAPKTPLPLSVVDLMIKPNGFRCDGGECDSVVGMQGESSDDGAACPLCVICFPSLSWSIERDKDKIV